MATFRWRIALLAVPVLVLTVFLAMQLAEGWQAADAATPGRAQSSGAATSDDPIVAEIGERQITLAELDEQAMQLDAGNFQGMRLKQALYEARRQTLEGLIAEQLLTTEAASRGIDRDQLIADEVTSKLEAVTDADVETWYTQNRQRVGNATVDQVRDQVRSLLEQERSMQAGRSFVESLRVDTAVSVLLDPPRTEVRVAANDPASGPEAAPIQIVEFSDFQ